MLKKYYFRLIHFLRKLVEEDNSAYSIAMGSALGIFIAFLPIVGFQIIPALFLSVRFRVNKLAAMAAVWITNPITIIPVYLFNFWIGNQILPEKYSVNLEIIKENFKDGITWKELISIGLDGFMTLLTGSLIVSTVTSIITYYFVRKVVIFYHKYKSGT